ncbi:MAG: hypothetical protein IKQ39_00135 [Oscillospiraceae bacterium]|nr:hypothetical protein [Oscillospiraceae bacterium]
MSKSIFKKTAAIVCSAATLVVLSATAMLAGAQETLTKEDRASEIAADGPTLMADEVYAEPGEKVQYGLFLANNKGFSSCNGYFIYDERLAPYVWENDTAEESVPWEASMGIDVDPDFTYGESDTPTSAKYGRNPALYMTPSLNGNVHRFAFGTIGEKVNSCPDGLMFYTYFKVPDSAKPGDEFPVELTITMFLDDNSDDTAFTKVNGWIKVKEVSTTTESTTTSETTTSETTTSETTTSETTTSETTTSETTTSETTTSETTTSETTTSDTTTSVDTSSTSTESTTSGTGTTGTTGTSPKGGTPAGTQAPGAKTGDAGVGAAVAGLLLAAGAAVAVASKKKED